MNEMLTSLKSTTKLPLSSVKPTFHSKYVFVLQYKRLYTFQVICSFIHSCIGAFMQETLHHWVHTHPVIELGINFPCCYNYKNLGSGSKLDMQIHTHICMLVSTVDLSKVRPTSFGQKPGQQHAEKERK